MARCLLHGLAVFPTKTGTGGISRLRLQRLDAAAAIQFDPRRLRGRGDR